MTDTNWRQDSLLWPSTLLLHNAFADDPTHLQLWRRVPMRRQVEVETIIAFRRVELIKNLVGFFICGGLTRHHAICPK